MICKQLNYLFILIVSFIVIAEATPQWTPTNGPYGGVVQKFATTISGSDTNIFAVTQNGGVYRSNNGGNNWEMASSGLADSGLDIYSIGSNINTVLLGIGRGSAPYMFRSNDVGGNWTRTSFSRGIPIAFATNDTFLFAAADEGVFRSADDGVTWEPNFYTTITQFTKSKLALATIGRVLFLGGSDGAYKSIDNGLTWSPINTGLPTDGVIIRTMISRDTVLFAGVDKGFSGTNKGVYYSTNRGASWKAATSGVTNKSVTALTASASYIYAIADDTVYRSVDNGANWTAIDNGLPTNIGEKNCILSCGSKIFLGHSVFGVYSSDDNGDTWRQSNFGLTNISFPILKTNNGSVFIGRDWSLGIFRSINNGFSWDSINTGDPQALRDIGFLGQYLFACSDGGILRSSNGGISWSFTYIGHANMIGTFGSKMFMGNNRIYRSDDSGATWELSSSGLPNAYGSAGFAYCDSVLFAGTFAGIYRSLDSGVTWNAANNGLSSLSISRLVVAGKTIFTKSNAIYKTTDYGVTWTPIIIEAGIGVKDIEVLSDHRILATTTNGVYITKDNGSTWTLTKIDGFVEKKVFHIASVGDTMLYAATTGFGIWKCLLLPYAPTLLLPTTNVTNLPVIDTFSWNPVPSATSYNFQISTDASFATNVTNKTGIGSTSITISGLLNSTNYYWRVCAVNASGNGDWSSTYKLTTIIAAPAIPTMTAPSNYSVNIPTSINIEWNMSPTAESYGLQVSEDTAFVAMIFNQNNLTTTSQTLSGLDNSKTYFWKVNATNIGGTSDWSSIFNFTTVPPPPTTVPILITPIDNDNNQPLDVNLSWSSIATASTYGLQVSSDSTFSTTVISLDQSGTSHVASGLINNTLYYWRVQGRNSGGNGPWSLLGHFKTIPGLPNSPTTISPVNNSIDQPMTVNIAWSSVATAVFYSLQVSADSSFGTILNNELGLTDTSKVLDNLNRNTTYYWRVSATNVAGTGAWSSVSHFKTLVDVPLAPSLVSPANSTTNQPISLTLSWGVVSTAITYGLQVASDSNFTTMVFNQSGLTGTSQLVTGLSNTSVYYWRVNASNSFGVGPWSQKNRFTTIITLPAVPVPLLPADNVKKQPNPLLFTWDTSLGALFYNLQISTDSTFAATIVNQTGIGACSLSVSSLSYSMSYYWRVRAVNVTGNSGWSVIRSFETGIPIPNKVLLTMPEKNGTITIDSAMLQWNKSTPSVTNYLVIVGTDSEFTDVIVDTLVTDTILPIKALANGKKYFWKVRALNESGWGLFSDLYYFQVDIYTKTEVETIIPTELTLQSAPNPFNPEIRLSVGIPQNQQDALLLIFNMKGILIKEWKLHGTGYHTIAWNGVNKEGKAVASGTYLAQLHIGSKTVNSRILFIK